MDFLGSSGALFSDKCTVRSSLAQGEKWGGLILGDHGASAIGAFYWRGVGRALVAGCFGGFLHYLADWAFCSAPGAWGRTNAALFRDPLLWMGTGHLGDFDDRRLDVDPSFFSLTKSCEAKNYTWSFGRPLRHLSGDKIFKGVAVLQGERPAFALDPTLFFPR